LFEQLRAATPVAADLAKAQHVEDGPAPVPVGANDLEAGRGPGLRVGLAGDRAAVLTAMHGADFAHELDPLRHEAEIGAQDVHGRPPFPLARPLVTAAGQASLIAANSSGSSVRSPSSQLTGIPRASRQPANRPLDRSMSMPTT